VFVRFVMRYPHVTACLALDPLRLPASRNVDWGGDSFARFSGSTPHLRHCGYIHSAHAVAPLSAKMARLAKAPSKGCK
jgi:hypothetical protein